MGNWVNEQRDILHEIRKRKANRIGQILLRNCLLKQVIEGKIKGEIEVTRRRGRRRKKLLEELKNRRGYYHLKEEALDRTMWRNRFGRGVGPVVRQITEWMNGKVLKLLYRSKQRWFSTAWKQQTGIGCYCHLASVFSTNTFSCCVRTDFELVVFVVLHTYNLKGCGRERSCPNLRGKSLESYMIIHFQRKLVWYDLIWFNFAPYGGILLWIVRKL